MSKKSKAAEVEDETDAEYENPVGGDDPNKLTQGKKFDPAPEVQVVDETPVPLGGNEPGVCPPSVVGTSHEPKSDTPTPDGDEAPGT